MLLRTSDIVRLRHLHPVDPRGSNRERTNWGRATCQTARNNASECFFTFGVPSLHFTMCFLCSPRGRDAAVTSESVCLPMASSIITGMREAAGGRHK